MKTTYTNEELQEAIDRACKGTSATHPEIGDAIALSTHLYPTSWNKEQAARLTLARAFLDNLPEQTEQGVLSLSQLRPLSEAGPVPEGCVRVRAWKHESQFRVSTLEDPGDTHFADIHLPSTEKAEARGKLWEYYSRKYGVMDWGYANRQEPDPYAELKKAHAEGKVIQLKPLDRPWEDLEDPDFAAPISCYRIKPEPETFQAHGKAWTRHTPGDPMPCDGERMVYVLTPKTGESEEPYKASMYSWTAKDYYWWGEIIGWRYADETLVTKSDSLPEWTPAVGMSLRDWFAGMALQGKATRLSNPHEHRDILAADCYDIADAMLKAREVNAQ
jgi:hypothetical protein